MATKRTSYLKRQKEQKRLERAAQKREDRMVRRLEKPDTGVHPQETELNESTSE